MFMTCRSRVYDRSLMAGKIRWDWSPNTAVVSLPWGITLHPNWVPTNTQLVQQALMSLRMFLLSGNLIIALREAATCCLLGMLQHP